MKLDEIKRSEGFKPLAYKKDGDRWTYGYGSTFKMDGSPVKEGDTITEKDASELLQHKIETEYLPQLNSEIKVSLNDNQHDALISLIYNIGIGNLRKSRLLRLINSSPNNPLIKNEWWVTNIRERSKFEKGLRARRIREAQLYFTL